MEHKWKIRNQNNKISRFKANYIDNYIEFIGTIKKPQSTSRGQMG